jgi:two-component system nitrogen regulation response regulator NtrX
MRSTTLARAQGRRARALAPGLVPLAIVGDSDAIRRARVALEQPGGAPLLILADEGLDASAVARYVHDRTRAGQPFVAVDCAQVDADALSTALFGVRTRAAAELETLGAGSALLAARRGTVLLDNLGELPAALQRRLARVMRDGEVRVAGRDRVRIDARLVAAGPTALPGDARDGRFRSDLLRRFGPAPVTIPALRLRPGDVPAIVRRIAADLSDGAGRPAPAFTPAALTMLAAMPWTRNVDELAATLARTFARVDAPVIRQEDLLPAVPLEAARRATPIVSLRDARRRFEREYIASVLEQYGWRMSDAARTLGIERANLYRKMRELGIQRGAPGGRG